MAGQGGDGPTAASLKEEGNAKFKAGEYAAAVEAYTRSLELDPSQHLCFSNRSAAYLKLGGLAEEALKDADQCVKLSSTFSKGYSRKAAALQELKRWDEAIQACDEGLKAAPDDTLKKMRAEVRNRHLQERLKGLWSGAVSETLGGYEQEMEFLSDTSVRVGVLGRSVVGSYWLDCGHEPNHLNIQVVMQDVPPGMPPPPPVPYICRIDDKGLHLCCPYMTMDRPSTFEGPGYCLMARGGLASEEDAEVAKMSKDERLLACAKELIKTLPDRALQEVQQSDSEEVTREKLMAQVKFESCMFAVQKKFGEDTMKEVLSTTRESSGAGLLAGTPELKQLRDKLRAVGVLDSESSEPPAVPKPSAEAKKAPAAPTAPKKEAAEPAPKDPAPKAATEEPTQLDAAAASSCGPAVIVPALLVAAAAAAVMILAKRPRS